MLYHLKKLKCKNEILGLNVELNGIEIKKLKPSLCKKSPSELELEMIRIETAATVKRTEIIEKSTELTVLTMKNNFSNFVLFIFTLASVKYFLFQ